MPVVVPRFNLLCHGTETLQVHRRLLREVFRQSVVDRADVLLKRGDKPRTIIEDYKGEPQTIIENQKGEPRTIIETSPVGSPGLWVPRTALLRR